MAKAKILVVEDPLVSNLVRAVLRRHGCEVTLAAAPEASDLIRSPESDIGILITNTPEPFLEFAERIPLLYLSSQPDFTLKCAFRSCQVVLKPFVPLELVQAVEALTQPV